MKQKEVGSLLGLSTETYGRMERQAKPPNDEILKKLALIYKMSVQEIEDYIPNSTYNNNFYDKVTQVNHIGSMVMSSIDHAIKKF